MMKPIDMKNGKPEEVGEALAEKHLHIIREVVNEWFDTCCVCGKVYDSRIEGVTGFDAENPTPYINAQLLAESGDYCNRCAFLMLVG
jgi:hypothetical protein